MRKSVLCYDFMSENVNSQKNYIDEIMNNLEMKKKVRKEYSLRKSKILKSKLNSGNVVKAIDLREVALLMALHQTHEMIKR